MILITGGFGFLGLNTTRAFLDLGESCVLTRFRRSRQPEFIRDELGKRVFVEQLDAADRPAFLEIGRRHRITGIVHLPGAGVGSLPLVDQLRMDIGGLLNALDAAREWGVARISVASTVGVYFGGPIELPLREDVALTVAATHPIPTVKKTFELLSTLVAGDAGFGVAMLRISAIWGPFGRSDSPFFALPRLVDAAVKGEVLDPARPVYAENGIDMPYVRDAGRAIALLQTAERLNHSVYNVGTGRATTNAEVVAAIRRAVPNAHLELREGRDPNGPGQDPYLDITRLRQDTGYEPAYDVERGVADYVSWLRAGDAG